MSAPLEDRIRSAMLRIGSGNAPMRIPADPTDPDIVLGECLERIGKLSTALALLRELQCKGGTGYCVYSCCPECGAWVTEYTQNADGNMGEPLPPKHAPDCRLAALLVEGT